MYVLAIDTTEVNNCSLSIVEVEEQSKIFVREITQLKSQTRNIAEVLVELISSALVENKLEITDIKQVAIAIGPGSFTGIRTGIATVYGLFWGRTETKIFGIGSFIPYVVNAILREQTQNKFVVFIKANPLETYRAELELISQTKEIKLLKKIEILSLHDLSKCEEGIILDSAEIVISAKDLALSSFYCSELIETIDLNKLELINPQYIKQVNAKTLKERGLV